MTPEQKEAFRREVLEEAAVHLEGRRSVFMRDAAAILRALAASQPAPAADTGQAVAWMYEKDGKVFVNQHDQPWKADTGWKITPLGPLTHPAPLDAERVKELMPEVWEWEAAAIFMEQYDDDDTGCVRRVVKFLRAAAAHRAALRQKGDE